MSDDRQPRLAVRPVRIVETKRVRKVADYTLPDDSIGCVEIHDWITATDSGVPMVRYGMGGLTSAQLRAIADHLDELEAR